MNGGVATALKIAMSAHAEQTDKGGKPYILHPLTVASRQTTIEGIIVALLHDVVEDSAYTLNDLREAGFSNAVINAVSLLTHNSEIPYFDYVRKIKENSLARDVKIQDLIHNMDLNRLSSVTDRDIERVTKYKEALCILTEK